VSRGPTLTLAALKQWLPTLVRRAPYLVSAYVIPGRVPAPTREATMLGVTSVNRCRACARFHERWGRAVGLQVQDPLRFTSGDAAAYAYGQALAIEGPRSARSPDGLSSRHRRELEATGVLMQLANLAGNRFLPERAPGRPVQIRRALTARRYDLAVPAAGPAPGEGSAASQLAASSPKVAGMRRCREHPAPSAATGHGAWS